MRSSNSFVYGLWTRSPLALRSRNSGTMYRLVGK
jgi:hypothetical protein